MSDPEQIAEILQARAETVRSGAEIALNVQFRRPSKARLVPSGDDPAPSLSDAEGRLAECCRHYLQRYDAGESIEAREIRRLQAAISDERIRAAYTAEAKERARLGVARWAKECFTHDPCVAVELSVAWSRYEAWAASRSYGSCQFPPENPSAPKTPESERKDALELFDDLLREAGIRSDGSGHSRNPPRYIWGRIVSPDAETIAAPEPIPEEASEFLVLDKRRVALPEPPWVQDRDPASGKFLASR